MLSKQYPHWFDGIFCSLHATCPYLVHSIFFDWFIYDPSPIKMKYRIFVPNICETGKPMNAIATPYPISAGADQSKVFRDQQSDQHT